MNEQLWWHVARSTGIVAWTVLTLAVLWGVLLSTRLPGKKPKPAWLLDLHRYLGAVASVFTAVHLAALAADSYVDFGPVDLLVPMASAWRPGPVAWGVASLYLLLAVEATSLVKRRLPMKVWRRAHLLSFPLWVVASLHFATAGTDTANRLAQWALAASVVAVLFTSVVRVLSPRPQRRTSDSRMAATTGSP